MAGKNSNSGSSGAPDGAPDPTGGQSDDAAGAANQQLRTGSTPVDALDNGNSAPEGGSPDARLAQQAAEQARTDALANAATGSQREPIDMRIVSGATPSAPTKDMDKTIPGGLTMRADRTWQNAHGMDVDEEGTILDTPRNRETDPARFAYLNRPE